MKNCPLQNPTQRQRIALFMRDKPDKYFTAKVFQDGGWWFVGWQAINRLSDLQRNGLIEGRWITSQKSRIKEYKITPRGLYACKLITLRPKDKTVQYTYFTAKDRSQLSI